MNNKGQTSTDTPILLAMIVFQAFIIIGIGFLDTSNTEITKTVYGNSFISFSVNIITNIGILGWGNILIFAPLEICLIYIVAKLIRGGG